MKRKILPIIITIMLLVSIVPKYSFASLLNDSAVYSGTGIS